MLLNFVFRTHAALALLLAFLLAFFTKFITGIAVVGFNWPTDLMLANVIVAYARLAAAGLILLAFAAGYAAASGYSVVRWAALFSLVVVGLVFVLVAAFMPLSPLGIWLLWVNLAFVVIYVIYWFFAREQI